MARWWQHNERGALWRTRWAAIGAAVAVSVGAGGVVGWVSAASSPRSDFVAITPVRVLDTRDPVNVGLAGPFVSPTPQDLRITGTIATTAGNQVVVPEGATGVVLNVTAVGPGRAGFVSVRPANASGAPATSNLNVEAGTIVPNAVTVQVPTTGPDTGKIELSFDAYGAAGTTTDLLVDVVGYYAPAGPPVTGVLTIPYSGFLPGKSTGGYSYALTGHVGRSLEGVGGDGANRLLAPVMLPHGAVITSVTFGVRDNGAADASLSIFRVTKGSDVPNSPTLANTLTSGASTAVREFSAPVTASQAVVDNDRYLYSASIFMNGWDAADQMEIDYVTIRYTVP